MLEPKDKCTAKHRCFSFWNPELWGGEPLRVPVLIKGGRLRLRGPVLVFQIDDDAGGAVVERLHHFTFIEWNPLARRAGEAVAADGIRALPLLKLRARAEEAGILYRRGQGLAADMGEHEAPDFLPKPRYYVLRKEDMSVQIALKDVTSTTNARSVITCLLPPYAAGHTLPILSMEPLMHMAPVARVCHQMLRLGLGRGNG